MNLPLFAVYGVSGYGREVMPLARAQLSLQRVSLDRLVFVDDNSRESSVNGHRVVGYKEFCSIDASERFVAIAIANPDIRRSLSERCAEDGIRAWTLIASNVVCLDDAIVGEGAILSPFVMLTSNLRIGRHFHANIYSYVAHDCTLGDFVTFAPAVKCNGNVTIGDHAYIGTGAILRQGKPGQPLVIGRDAIVGMGAVVTKNVAAGSTVVGNPAKPLVK